MEVKRQKDNMDNIAKEVEVVAERSNRFISSPRLQLTSLHYLGRLSRINRKKL